ncbi:MAG: hypothetical protein HQL47_01770 [Gammaproteobacteria bacterium]|nr:hypothetical protein [Gammaproteobacteria bacterium]
MTASQQPPLPEDARLGETAGEWRFAGRDQQRDLCLSLARQARREVLIFTQNLDPHSFNSLELYEALKQLALRRPDPALRILLQDHEPVRRGGYRLLELAQRLSSRVLIHRPHLQEHREHRENFVLVDEVGYLYQPLYSRPEGSVSFHNPARARQLGHFFNEVWQQSEQDSLLRRLAI